MFGLGEPTPMRPAPGAQNAKVDNANLGSGRYLLVADRALELFERNGDPSGLVALPTAIRRLLEDRIEQDLSQLRLHVHQCALRARVSGNYAVWMRQAQSLSASQESVWVTALWCLADRQAEIALGLLDDTLLLTGAP